MSNIFMSSFVKDIEKMVLPCQVAATIGRAWSELNYTFGPLKTHDLFSDVMTWEAVKCSKTAIKQIEMARAFYIKAMNADLSFLDCQCSIVNDAMKGLMMGLKY